MEYELYHGTFLIGTINSETHEVTPRSAFCHDVVRSFVKLGTYSFQPIHNMFGITRYEVVYVNESL